MSAGLDKQVEASAAEAELLGCARLQRDSKLEDLGVWGSAPQVTCCRFIGEAFGSSIKDTRLGEPEVSA